MSSPNDYPTDEELGLTVDFREDIAARDPRPELEALLVKFRRIGPLSSGRLTGTVERSDVMRFIALIEQLLNHD